MQYCNYNFSAFFLLAFVNSKCKKQTEQQKMSAVKYVLCIVDWLMFVWCGYKLVRLRTLVIIERIEVVATVGHSLKNPHFTKILLFSHFSFLF